MPYIDPQYLECTVYLYPSEAAAEDGERVGGTGFLISFPAYHKGNDRILAVATNRHVVENGNMVVRLNKKDGSVDILALDGEKWFHHPDGDDLSICPIIIRKFHKVRSISSRSFLTKADIEAWDFGPGEDIFVVGRFINHEGKQKNLPSLRFGNIAQMPGEPIISDGYPQESFLVECRSISGYSGAPVFLNPSNPPLPGITKEGKEMILNGTMKVSGVSPNRMRRIGWNGWPIGIWLLGINYCYLRSTEPVRNGANNAMHDWTVETNTGMMGVIPAWRLLDIIEGSEMSPLKKAVADADAKAAADSSEVLKRQRTRSKN